MAPLFLSVIALSCWGLIGPVRARRSTSTPIAIGLGLVLVAAAAQLVPLPSDTLAAFSPATNEFLQSRNLSYLDPNGVNGHFHPISIEPLLTQRAVAILAILSVFLLALLRMLDGEKLRQFVPLLIVIGTLLAMAGIVQKSFSTAKIYGLWTPYGGSIIHSGTGGPFGPFINRNHFAGWMLMTIPVAIGYLCAILQRNPLEDRFTLRKFVIWTSTPAANQALLVAFAVGVMSLALVMTLSRSGILSFGLAVAVSLVVILRSQSGYWRKVSAILAGTVLVGGAVAWGGSRAVFDRFEQADLSFNGRLFVWRDTVEILRDFPWAGIGLNTYGVAMVDYQTFMVGATHFAQAHNDYLQLLTEGGILLAVPVAVLAVLVATEVRKQMLRGGDSMGLWLRIGAATGIVAILLQEVVEFSLQMPGNAVLFTVLLAIAARSTGVRVAGEPSVR